MLTSCELLEDVIKDHPTNTRKHLIGIWENDSLVTKHYENGVLTEVTTQSLKGYTFELKTDDTYINTNPQGNAYLNGTWELVKAGNIDQILLDKNTSNERGYNIVSLSETKLLTKRKVSVSESSTVEYTFSYNK